MDKSGKDNKWKWQGMEMRNKASAGEYRKENKESVRTGGKRNKL